MFVKTANTNKTKSNNNFNAKNSSAFIQPKLNIGKSGDKYEVEADKMADQVVAKTKEPSSTFIAPSSNIQKQADEEVQTQKESTIQEKPLVDNITPVVQSNSEEKIQEKCDKCESEENDIQKKSNKIIQKVGMEFPEIPETILEEKGKETNLKTNEEDKIKEPQVDKGKEINNLITLPNPKKEKKEKPLIQTKNENNTVKKSNTIESSLNNSKGGGTSLNNNVKNEMNEGFGADFKNVKIHTDTNAIQMNKDLGSHAFTNGNNIYFNQGKYNPSVTEGKHLLAHELTHTIQQGASSSSIQKFEPTEKIVTPESGGVKPNDGAQVEGKANNKIDNDTNVEEGADLSDEEKREKENPNRGEVRTERANVQSQGISSPEVDRGAVAVEKTTTQKAEMDASLSEEQPVAEEETVTNSEGEELSNISQADLAAQQAVQSEQAALNVKVPSVPQVFVKPRIEAPVDSAGKELPRQGSIDTQVRGLGYIGEMLRQKGYEIKTHAAEKEIHSYGQDAVIAKQKEDLALAKEGTALIETQNVERKEISEKSKLALEESKQRQQFVAEKAPELVEEANSGKSDSSALANDSKTKATQSQSNIPDDEDARADGEQQVSEMNQTAEGTQSMDDAITQTGERATQYIQDSQVASEDNQQSEASILENDGLVNQIDGRASEMNAMNVESEASIENVVAGPNLVRQHAARAAASGDELIAASIVMETELISIQEEYLSSMAGIESKETAEQRVREEQEANAPEVSPQEQQLYELASLSDEEQQVQISQMGEEEKQGLLATLDMTIANTPDNGTDATEGARTEVKTNWSQGLQNAQDTGIRFGLEVGLGSELGGLASDALGLGVPDPADPRAQDIQTVDNARTQRLSGVLDIADQNMNRLTVEQQQLLAERLVAEAITDDIANINILQMGKDMLKGMVNPAMALQGVVGGLEKTFSGVANIFNAEAWEKDPLGNLLQIAADISTGLAMVFSSILGIAGMITALMIALTIFSWGTLAPITGPVIGWMGTVMTYAGWGAIVSGLLSVYFNSLAYIKNLSDAGTAETARELFGNTEQMKQNTTDGFQGAMAVVEGVGAVKMAPGMRSGQLLADLPPNPGAFARQTMNGVRNGISSIASLPARAVRGARRLFAGGKQGLIAFKQKIVGFFRHTDAPDVTPNTRHTNDVLDGNRTRTLDEMTPEQRRIDLQETANHQPRAIEPDSPYHATHDIEIESNGHTYRRRKDGKGWCRFSTQECGIGDSELPDDVRAWIDDNDRVLRENGALDDSPEAQDAARQDAEQGIQDSDASTNDRVDDTLDIDTTPQVNPNHTTRQKSFETDIKRRLDNGDITPTQAQQLRDFNEANPSGTRNIDSVLEDINNPNLEFNPETGRYRETRTDSVPRQDLPEAGSQAHQQWQDFQEGRTNVPCFPKNTLIATVKGFKDIQDVKVNDYVWAYDHINNKTILEKVTNNFVNWTQYLMQIYVGNIKISATPNHSFWVESEKKYICAENLKEGMNLLSSCNNNQVITKIKKTITQELTYNIEVRNMHNYFVSNLKILVHNDELPKIGSFASNQVRPSSIYVLTDRMTGKVIYVGQTVQHSNVRFTQHITDSKSSVYKYLERELGTGFSEMDARRRLAKTLEVDNVNLTHYELSVLEQHHIDLNHGIDNLENDVNAITEQNRRRYAELNNPCQNI